MLADFSRRRLFQLLAGAGATSLARQGQLLAQGPSQSYIHDGSVLPPPIATNKTRAAVSLIKGEDRRKNVTAALTAIDDQIKPLLKRKKYVVIKPNNVSTVNQLAASHADGIRGIMDYLEPRFKGPVVIAESSAGDTMQGFENFKYTQLPGEFKRNKITLVDLNAEAKYVLHPLLTPDMHVQPVRLAARLLDPDAFVISSGLLKTHNVAIATLGIKNMTLGAPLHQPPGERKRWNDKRKYHGGVRQTLYNMMRTAQLLSTNWHVDLIDGFEGMEGNGPGSGTPVQSRVALASTDFVAGDRVAAEVMGVDPMWLAYLHYCWQVGLGQFEPTMIDIRGEKVAAVAKKYQMHKDIERELQWRGPMEELPPRLG